MFLEKLHALGFEIIIYTTRCCMQANPGHDLTKLVNIVKAWLDKNSLPYDHVFNGQGKPFAVAYVDDRAVPCRHNGPCVVGFGDALEHIMKITGIDPRACYVY
jgi:hypothetical protein